MPWDNWVLDATMGWPPCFCPVELTDEGEIKSIVTGLNVIGTPPEGRVIAIVHADGQEAVDEFCEAYKDELTVVFPNTPCK